MNRFIVAISVCALCACGEPSLQGADEPIRVKGGTFKEGDLPGVPQGDGEPEGTRVTVVESLNNVLRRGQVGKNLSGRATDDATAVGLQLEGRGTGHWLRSLGPADPQAPGELTWSLSLDVAHDAPIGLQSLLLSAIDAEGRSGTQLALPVCVVPEVPDNLNACDPAIPPPAAVLSLAWDSDVDLDLVVFTPDGKFVDPKHPTTALPNEDGEIEPAEGDGVFDHDGLAGCSAAGARRENLVFQEKPAVGQYFVFVDLFDACGERSTRFQVSLHLAEGDPASPVEVLSIDGELLASQADAGTHLGLFVTDFVIQ